MTHAHQMACIALLLAQGSVCLLSRANGAEQGIDASIGRLRMGRGVPLLGRTGPFTI